MIKYILIALMSLSAGLRAEAHPWKIDTYSFDEASKTRKWPVFTAYLWATDKCESCGQITIYSHPQVKKKYLIEVSRKIEFNGKSIKDVKGGIWIKGTDSDNYKFVDCYATNGNNRNDDENYDYGERHGISKCYNSIGFNLHYGTNSFSYSMGYVINTAYTYEWQWQETALENLTNTAKDGKPLKNMFYDAETQLLHYQKNVKVEHKKVIFIETSKEEE